MGTARFFWSARWRYEAHREPKTVQAMLLIAAIAQHLCTLGGGATLFRKNIVGAQDRNRTSDTVIFSHVLYQLSYLGTEAGASGGGHF
jgi:hypothetical protein